MKSQMFIAVLAALVMCTNSAVLPPEMEVDPVRVVEAVEIADNDVITEAELPVTVEGIGKSKTVGSVRTDDMLLYSANYYKPAVPNAVQSEEVIYRADDNIRITSLSFTELENAMYPYLNIAGIGTSTATIRITSHVGYGYNLLVKIRGRLV